MTGLSIGWVTSVKMVGLFVTSLVGLYTVEDLWEKFGDLRMSTVRFPKQLDPPPTQTDYSATKLSTGVPVYYV